MPNKKSQRNNPNKTITGEGETIVYPKKGNPQRIARPFWSSQKRRLKRYKNKA